MNKAVFTDFDGVINTESDWKKGLYTFRKDKAMLIAEKVLHDDALLVITSSWRLGFTENDDDISITHFFHDAGIEHVYQTAALPDKRRTAEIERFLYYHREIKEYLIIDDDKDEYERPIAGLHLVNRKVGYTSGTTGPKSQASMASAKHTSPLSMIK